MEDDAVALTQEVADLLFAGETSQAVAYMGQGFSFVLPFAGSVGYGAGTFVVNSHKTMITVQAINLVTKSVSTVFSNKSISIILHVSTGSITENGGSIRLRTTFVWDKTQADVPKLIHIHSSIPAIERKSITIKPYSMSPVRHVDPRESLHGSMVVTDNEGATHTIWFREILYLEAAHQYVHIHLSNRVIKTRVSLTQMTETLPGAFARVHRSYTINVFAVRCLQGNVITLVNGDEIPIPGRKRAQIKRMLLNARGSSVGEVPPPEA